MNRYKLYPAVGSLTLLIGLTAFGYTHIVKKGESLSHDVAGKLVRGPVWGKDGSFNKILELNPSLQRPWLIYPGQKIELGHLLDETTLNSEPNPTPTPSISITPSPTPEPIAAASPIPKETPEPEQPFLKVEGLILDFQAINTSIDASNTQTAATLATSINATLDIAYGWRWKPKITTFLHAKSSFVTFEAPPTGTANFADRYEWLFGFGTSTTFDLLGKLRASVLLDEQKEFFVQTLSLTNLNVEAVYVPSFGVKLEWDALSSQHYILGLEGTIQEKLGGTGSSFKVNSGLLTGGGVYLIHRQEIEKPTWGLNLDLTSRKQNTSSITQNETNYLLHFRLFF